MAYAPSVLSRSASITEGDIRNKILVPGLKEDVEELNNTFISIQALLSDAENRQLTDEAVRVWVGRLRDISYEIEDVLDAWKTVQLKLEIIDTRKAQNQTGFYQPSFCSWLKHLAEKRDLPREIAGLKARMDVINKDKEVYKFRSETPVVTNIALQRPESSAFDDVPEVFGRDQQIELIKTKLLTSFSQESNIDIISIVGMGGMGKTTIAQRIFNEIEKKKFERMIWVCVSDPYDKIRVAKSIIEELGDDDSRSCSTLQSSLKSIKRSIAGVKFMLVLDDVWTKDPKDWKSLFNVLKTGARRSKILVTSRNKEVARVMESCYILDLEKLSEDESWKLFSQIAFSRKSEDKRKELEEVGKSIAKKCKGLPLALTTLASHLKFKAESEWHKVLRSDLWTLEAAKEIFVPLLFSYYELPFAMKKCFSYCAIFPKDHRIEVRELASLWMSQDYLKSSTNDDMETIGEEYFEHLRTRSFFQDIQYDKDTGGITHCKMHDIVHDFAQFLSKDESLIIDMQNKRPVLSSSCRKLRHLTVLNTTNVEGEVMSSSFSSSIQQRLHDLHTLRISRRSTVEEIGKNFQNPFQHLCFIKALDLSDNGIVVIPEVIWQFVHLRYLDLSRNSELKRLPETICELCNLQTLLLDGCRGLEELPEGIEKKLINLRHLGSQDVILPKGIGNLSSLRPLSWFNVGRDEGHGGEVTVVATIGDLRNLNNLQGKLGISRLRKKRGLTVTPQEEATEVTNEKLQRRLRPARERRLPTRWAKDYVI